MAESVAAVATAEIEDQVVAEAEAIVEAATNKLSANGSSPQVVLNGAVPATQPADLFEEDPEAAARRQMNRREFLTYAWGAALGLVTLESAGQMFLFLYPRFRAGEFGGKFFEPAADFGDNSTAPKGKPDGKFWMVTTEDGSPKAIYMVCTHLGCLYKWIDSNHRFECPCHGSKFSHDGFYIEGPAPRSLDYFEVTQENGQIVVDTGKKIAGDASADSPAKGAPIGTV